MAARRRARRATSGPRAIRRRISPSAWSSTRRPRPSSRRRSWPAAWPRSCTTGSGRGSACTRVVIGAETEHGERLERVWRAEGSLTAGAIADRLRWQLDGWLQGSACHRPTAGISRLWLTPTRSCPPGASARLLGQRRRDCRPGQPWAVARAGAARRRLGVGARVAGEPRPCHPGGAHPRRGRRPHRRAPRCRPRPRRGPLARCAPGPVTGLGATTTPSPPSLVDADEEPVTVSGRGALSAPPSAPVGRGATLGRGGRLGRSLAPGRALVGHGPAPPAGAPPGRDRRRPSPPGHPGARRWQVEATYD